MTFTATLDQVLMLQQLGTGRSDRRASRGGSLELRSAARWVDAVLPHRSVEMSLPAGRYGVVLHWTTSDELALVELIPVASPLNHHLFQGDPGTLADEDHHAIDDCRARLRLLDDADFVFEEISLEHDDDDAPANLFCVCDDETHAALVAWEEAFSAREDAPNFWDDCLAPLVEDAFEMGFARVRMEGVKDELFVLDAGITASRAIVLRSGSGALLSYFVDFGRVMLSLED